MTVTKTAGQVEPPIPNKGTLINWAREILAAQEFPIKITVEVDKNGETTIERVIDGRTARGNFISWLAGEFQRITHIVPPAKKNTKAFNKMWGTPLMNMLRQSVYKGGVDFDNLSVSQRYTRLHGATFSFLIRDAWEKQQEAGLTTANPLSIEKVAIHTAISGNHYRSAKQYMARQSSSNQ
jgi:hypothetical protein